MEGRDSRPDLRAIAGGMRRPGENGGTGTPIVEARTSGGEARKSEVIAARTTGERRKGKAPVINARTPSSKAKEKDDASAQAEGGEVTGTERAAHGQKGAAVNQNEERSADAPIVGSTAQPEPGEVAVGQIPWGPEQEEKIAAQRRDWDRLADVYTRLSQHRGEEKDLHTGEPVQLARGSSESGDVRSPAAWAEHQQEQAGAELVAEKSLKGNGNRFNLGDGENDTLYGTYTEGCDSEKTYITDYCGRIISEGFDELRLFTVRQADGAMVEGLIGEHNGGEHILRPPTIDEPRFEQLGDGFDYIFFEGGKFYGKLAETDIGIEMNDTFLSAKKAEEEDFVPVAQFKPSRGQWSEKDPVNEQPIHEGVVLEREPDPEEVAQSVMRVLRDVVSAKHDSATDFNAWANQPYAVDALTTLAALHGEELKGTVADKGEAATSEDYRIVTDALNKMREESDGETVLMDEAMDYVQHRHLNVLENELEVIVSENPDDKLTPLQTLTGVTGTYGSVALGEQLLQPHPTTGWIIFNASTVVLSATRFLLENRKKNAKFEQSQSARIFETKEKIAALQRQLGLEPEYTSPIEVIDGSRNIQKGRGIKDYVDPRDLYLRINPRGAIDRHYRAERRIVRAEKDTLPAIEGAITDRAFMEICVARQQLLTSEQLERAQSILAQREQRKEQRQDKRFRSDDRRV